MNAVKPRDRTEILRPGNVRRSQRVEGLERRPDKEVVYVNEKRKPASVFWIVVGCLLGLMMLLSFFAWLAKHLSAQSEKAMVFADKQSQRAHELATTAVEQANQVAPVDDGSGAAWIIVAGFIGLAVIMSIIGMARGVAA